MDRRSAVSPPIKNPFSFVTHCVTSIPQWLFWHALPHVMYYFTSIRMDISADSYCRHYCIIPWVPAIYTFILSNRGQHRTICVIAPACGKKLTRYPSNASRGKDQVEGMKAIFFVLCHEITIGLFKIMRWEVDCDMNFTWFCGSMWSGVIRMKVVHLKH